MLVIPAPVMWFPTPLTMAKIKVVGVVAAVIAKSYQSLLTRISYVPDPVLSI